MFSISTAKSLFAAAILAVTFASTVPATEARADVDVDVGIGIGVGGPYGGGYYGGGYYGGYHGGYGPYDGYDGGYRRPSHYELDAYVSCRDGRRILSRRGYYSVAVQSCGRGFYRYTAWRHGRYYLMAVDARGEVSRLRRIR